MCCNNGGSGELINVTVYSAVGNQRVDSGSFFGLEDNTMESIALRVRFSEL